MKVYALFTERDWGDAPPEMLSLYATRELAETEAHHLNTEADREVAEVRDLDVLTAPHYARTR